MPIRVASACSIRWPVAIMSGKNSRNATVLKIFSPIGARMQIGFVLWPKSTIFTSKRIGTRVTIPICYAVNAYGALEAE